MTTGHDLGSGIGTILLPETIWGRTLLLFLTMGEALGCAIPTT
jgi:hypothetical protein